jgi:hypothetical protein
MAVRRVPGLCFVVLALALALQASQWAAAQELLRNGGFEEGFTAWSGQGLSLVACQPHQGNGALGLVVEGQQFAFLQQTIGPPLAPGAYTLSGLSRSGSQAVLRVDLVWLDGADAQLRTTETALPNNQAYTHFSITDQAPAGSVRLRLYVSLGGENGELACFDGLSIDGPPPPPATPTATATPPQSTATSTSTPASSGAPPASSPTSIPTSAPGSATPAPGLSLTFTNGGFEQGLTNWQKFGGELDTLTNPRRSGGAAGVLRSSTTSTKWAYQTVAVSSGRHYEFAGYVQSGSGVASTLLRISWYAQADGSGAAMATDDSTETMGASSSGFVYLTTGAVDAPDGARSARVRVLLTPLGEAAAAIFMDDFTFREVEAPLATSTPVVTLTTTPTPLAGTARAEPTSRTDAGVEVEPTPRSRSATGAMASATASSRSSTPASTRTPGGLTAGAQGLEQVQPQQTAEGRLETHEEQQDEGVPLLWLGGAALFVIGLAGAYFKTRRQQT